MRIVRLRAGLAAGLAMVGGLAACAPARITGRDFPLQPFNEFTLKKTTDQDVRNALGEPFQSNMLTQTVTNSNTPFPVGTPLTITKLNYMYNTSNGGPETGGRPAIKMAIFQFFGGIMFSDVFLSTFPNDAMPGFDESKLSLLRQGVTTRREVIALLGTPNGQSVSLLSGPRAQGRAIYFATHNDGQQVHNRVLLIDFNARDVVLRYALSDQQGPFMQNPLLQRPSGAAPYVPPAYIVPQLKTPPGPRVDYPI